MDRTLALTALVVRDYDEAIAFYVDVLGFRLVEDTPIPAQGKRWVVVAPPGPAGSGLLLARAVGEEQVSRIGNQTGGRVFLFLHTDDFWRDYRRFREQGVEFVREPKAESYGHVAVFRDLYGNLWDLVEPAATGPAPRQVVRAWVDAFNRADPDALAALYAEDAVNHQVMWEPIEGREAIGAMFRRELGQAEMTCIVENLFEDGEWAILEWRDPKGLRGCGFFHVVDGRIRFQRGYWDELSFRRQQGLPLPDR